MHMDRLVEAVDATLEGSEEYSVMDAARTVSATIRKQIDFILSGEVHSYMSRADMMERLDVTINKLSHLAMILSGRPTGFEDPADPFAIDCVLGFRYEQQCLIHGVHF